MARQNTTRTPLRLEPLEHRVTPVGGFLAVAPDVGGGPVVRVFAEDGTEMASFLAFEQTFTGGVRVSVGDVTGDGVADVIAGAGEGGAPLVRVFDGATFTPVGEFFAYESSFRGGVHVATGNTDDDPELEILAGAGTGGGPLVRVFDFGGDTAAEFFAFDPSFRGGVRVAAGNFDGIPGDEVVTGAGLGGAPHVGIFAGDGTPQTAFFAYDPGVRGGVSVAAGDLDQDGFAEVVTGPGVGGGPHVRVFAGPSAEPSGGFFAYDPGFRNGVRVGVGDANGDGSPDVITGAGPGGGPHLRAFDGRTSQEVTGQLPFDAAFRGGLFVAGRVAGTAGRTTGRFENPRPESSESQINVSENTIAWGRPFDGPGGGRSSMIFHSNPFTSTTNEIFNLGALTYVNKVIDSGTGADGADLVVTVRPNGVGPDEAVEIRIPVTIDDTLNTDDPEASADTVTLPASIPSQVITFPDGSHKTLEFFGFAKRKEDVLTNRVTDFTVREGDFGAVGLYARFIEQPLSSGVYVASRDLASLPVGSHQFLILVPQDPSRFTGLRDLGDGTRGLVLGAHNRGRLLAVDFEASDFRATQEFVNPDEFVSIFRPDFDTEVAPVNLSGTGLSVDEAIRRLINAKDHYVTNEASDNIDYPDDGGLTDPFDCLNSNSWAQSIVEFVAGPGRVAEDFSGADLCHGNRIDFRYFR